jgi:hypothetical protein
MMTRKEYIHMAMYSDLTDAQLDKLHREYYAQFVTPSTIAFVENYIGVPQIKASTDLHFNDIPLRMWDALDGLIRPMGARINKTINGESVWSLADTVRVAKEAAMQIKERQ